MSASIASAFPSQNVLYDTASGATTANVQNRLLQNQEANQQAGATDMEMVYRAAGTLLNMNEADAAAPIPASSRTSRNRASRRTRRRTTRVTRRCRHGAELHPDLLTVSIWDPDGAGRDGCDQGGKRAADAGNASWWKRRWRPTRVHRARSGPDRQRRGYSRRACGTRHGSRNRARDYRQQPRRKWRQLAKPPPPPPPPPRPGDSGVSHGLFQWNGDRLAAFQAANGGKLPEQTSLGAQLDFAANEWKADHNGAATAASQFNTAEGKIAPIVSKYEVSANQPAWTSRGARHT